MAKIIRRTGELTKGKKVTELGYIFANEPHWFSEKDHWTYNYKEMNGISSYTLNNFRSWLNIKYNGNIKALNSNWKSSFANFNNVNIEIPIDIKLQGGEPIWFDWNRYNMDRVTEWFKFNQDNLHAVNPRSGYAHKIISKNIL
ncbi:beta-galactosidase [Algibacter lectus]|uniref:beta-galactosidase n=1 Tax=Algibacter lectus TaxID=221126 RepID=UPI001D10B461|nr:beta-galactosidase [Algibacter lectus]